MDDLAHTEDSLEVILNSISMRLGVNNVALLVSNGGMLCVRSAIGYEGILKLRASENAKLLALLKSSDAVISLVEQDSHVLLSADPESASEEEDVRRLTVTLLLPIYFEEELTGCLLIGEKTEGSFSETDTKFLSTMGSLIPLVLQKNYLSEERKRSKWLFQELEAAREMYEALLPKSFQGTPGLDCAGDCRQVFFIGGDYYDFIPLPDGRLAFIICDISGKGITAALMMANLRVALRRLISRYTPNLAGLMSHLNQLIYEASPASRYATLFYAQFDPRTSRLQYVNAGHVPPLLLRRKPKPQPPKLLKEGGTIVGMWEDAKYQQGTEILQPGDVIVAYTDGVPEAQNARGEEWGEQRLQEELELHCETLDTASLIQHLFTKIDQFVDGARQFDDMTFVIIKGMAP